MRIRNFLLLLPLLLLTLSFSSSDNFPSYRWYSGDGKKIDLEKIQKEVLKADIVFFGELHNDVQAHWLQLILAQHLFNEKGKNLVMGCEMFESDNQLVLNEFLRGLINEKKLKENARLWDNYATDYAPLINFAKSNKIPVIATNTPRRYASMVFSGGFEALDSLSPAAKAFLPPLPIVYDTTVNCYKQLLVSNMMGHSSPNLPKAQALKDATMAHFILNNWNPGNLFFHWNGSYHSDRHEGIIWYLKQMRPDLKIYVISTVTQQDIGKLEEEHKGKADALLVTDASFPVSH
jgi:uncharacterized iron-regulated protein